MSQAIKVSSCIIITITFNLASNSLNSEKKVISQFKDMAIEALKAIQSKNQKYVRF